MNINNKNLKHFDIEGIQLPFVGIMEINNNITILNDNPIPIINKQQVSAQKRVLKVDFISSEGMSRFTAEISSESVLNIDDGYEYLCFYNGIRNISQETENRYVVEYDILCIKRSHKKKFIISDGSKLLINSTYNVNSCIYTIKCKKDIVEIDINGNIVSGLKANDVFIIDGINKKVIKNGVNAFSKCKLLNNYFPFLNRGINNINISNAETVDVVVEYHEIWI